MCLVSAGVEISKEAQTLGCPIAYRLSVRVGIEHLEARGQTARKAGGILIYRDRQQLA